MSGIRGWEHQPEMCHGGEGEHIFYHVFQYLPFAYIVTWVATALTNFSI